MRQERLFSYLMNLLIFNKYSLFKISSFFYSNCERHGKIIIRVKANYILIIFKRDVANGAMIFYF